MGGKGKKTKWKKFPLGDVPSDDGKGTNHSDPQHETTAAQPSSARSDVSSSTEGNSNEGFQDEDSTIEPDEQAPLTGCYINGLWMPLDYEKIVTCHPFYAPYTVLPFCSGGMYSAPVPMVNRIPCTDNNSFLKQRHSTPYWSSSYIPPAEGYSEDNTIFVPYLYPGYTFGPSVYGTPPGSFIAQGGKKKRKRRFKPSYQENRKTESGVDIISTPSCDIIRYPTPSAGREKKPSSVPNKEMIEESHQINETADVSVDVPKSSDSAENVSKMTADDKETVVPSKTQTESKEGETASGGAETNTFPPNNPTETEREDQATTSAGVRTVSRFKVYPCLDDPLKAVQESNRQPSPSRPSYFTSSETLLRETELELNRLNKKVFQANQSIYQLAFDESVDDDSAPGSRAELADFVEVKNLATKQEDLPEELREPPGSRMEIEVHEMDSESEAGSEDVEILPHRYDTFAPTEKHVYVNKLSLATELLRTKESLPYDSDFKRLVEDEDVPCVEFDRRISSLDSGVQSEDSGDEVIEEPKAQNTQKEEIWYNNRGQHYRRTAPPRIPYLSSATSEGPFPCLCCIIM